MYEIARAVLNVSWSDIQRELALRKTNIEVTVTMVIILTALLLAGVGSRITRI